MLILTVAECVDLYGQRMQAVTATELKQGLAVLLTGVMKTDMASARNVRLTSCCCSNESQHCQGSKVVRDLQLAGSCLSRGCMLPDA